MLKIQNSLQQHHNLLTREMYDNLLHEVRLHKTANYHYNLKYRRNVSFYTNIKKVTNFPFYAQPSLGSHQLNERRNLFDPKFKTDID